jgi:DNA (cytosine-5)-methyltransferase 3A
MQYVRALHESGAKYFLYENNFSIHKDIKAFISEQLGVQPIMINSALVSAQQRKRCYWTNIPGVTQPEDKGILLKDILEGAVSWQDKSYCMTSSYNGAVLWNTLERGQRTMVAKPVPSVDTDVPVNPMPDGKSRTLKAQYSHTSMANFVRDDNLAASGAATPVMRVPEATKQGYVDVNMGECVDLTQPNSTTRRGRLMKDKSNCLTTSPEFYQAIAPVRIGNIGKTTGQANRVYSVRGKSVCLQSQAGGSGAKTGLYKIDLPDGDYIIRKLTPVEAERLQTLPDNYTEGISNSQRYKCIGNGWTVDVIAHILSFLKEDNYV